MTRLASSVSLGIERNESKEQIFSTVTVPERNQERDSSGEREGLERVELRKASPVGLGHA